LLSGTVNIVAPLGAGTMSLVGDDAGNNIAIAPSAVPANSNSYTITANNGTQLELNGAAVASPCTVTAIFGNIAIDLGAGSNVLSFAGPVGTPPSANPIEGNITIDDTVNDANTLANLQALGTITFQDLTVGGALSTSGDANSVNNTISNVQAVGPVTIANGATNTATISGCTFYQGLSIVAPPSTVSSSNLTISGSTAIGPLGLPALSIDNTCLGTTYGSCTTILSNDNLQGGSLGTLSVANGYGSNNVVTITGTTITGSAVIENSLVSHGPSAHSQVTVSGTTISGVTGSLTIANGNGGNSVAIGPSGSTPTTIGGALDIASGAGDATVSIGAVGGVVTTIGNSTILGDYFSPGGAPAVAVSIALGSGNDVVTLNNANVLGNVDVTTTGGSQVTSQTTIGGSTIQGQLNIGNGDAGGAGNRVTIQPNASVQTVIGTTLIETFPSAPLNATNLLGDAVVITNGEGGSFSWFDGTSGDPVVVMGGIDISNGSSLTAWEQTNVNVIQFTYANVAGAVSVQDGLDDGSSLQTQVNTFNSNLGLTKRVDRPSPVSVQNAGGYASFQMTSSDAPWGVAVDNDALSPPKTFWGSLTTVTSSAIGDGPWGPRLDVSLSNDTNAGDALLVNGDNGSDVVNITTTSKIDGTARLNLLGGSNTVVVSAATITALTVNTGGPPPAAKPGLDSVSISGSTIVAGLDLNLNGVANAVVLSDGGTPGGEVLPDLVLGSFEIAGGGVSTSTDTLTVSSDLLPEINTAITDGMITNFSAPVVKP
jgi:hypothetical protein